MWGLIAMHVLDTEKAAGGGVVDNDGAALDEYYVYYLEIDIKITNAAE